MKAYCVGVIEYDDEEKSSTPLSAYIKDPTAGPDKVRNDEGLVFTGPFFGISGDRCTKFITMFVSHRDARIFADLIRMELKPIQGRNRKRYKVYAKTIGIEEHWDGIQGGFV